MRFEAIKYVWKPESPRIDQMEKKQMTSSTTVHKESQGLLHEQITWPLLKTAGDDSSSPPTPIRDKYLHSCTQWKLNQLDSLRTADGGMHFI